MEDATQLPLRTMDSNYSTISAGGNHTCGVLTNGRAHCWGYNGDGRTSVPAGLTSFRTISAGWYHTCGVLTNGRAHCWDDILKYLNPEMPLQDLVSPEMWEEHYTELEPIPGSLRMQPGPDHPNHGKKTTSPNARSTAARRWRRDLYDVDVWVLLLVELAVHHSILYMCRVLLCTMVVRLLRERRHDTLSVDERRASVVVRSWWCTYPSYRAFGAGALLCCDVLGDVACAHIYGSHTPRTGTRLAAPPRRARPAYSRLTRCPRAPPRRHRGPRPARR